MTRLRDAYTRYPRPLLWLVEGEGPIDSFYISKLPVTNRQFEAYDPGFERASTAPEDDDPALGISFDSARAYAAWYAEVARKPMRLPTVDEWRWATSGREGWPAEVVEAGTLDDHAWHVGNSPDPARVPRLDAKRHNPRGLYATLGGVWEWCQGDDGIGRLCGGSFRTPPDRLLDAPVISTTELAGLDDVGFRIAKSMR